MKDQSPLGRTVQLLRTLIDDGAMAGMREPVFYREESALSAEIDRSTDRSPLAGVIPKPRVFSSGARDLPAISCRLAFVQILPVFRQVFPATTSVQRQGDPSLRLKSGSVRDDAVGV